MITSRDSKVRILEGVELVKTYKGRDHQVSIHQLFNLDCKDIFLFMNLVFVASESMFLYY
jgi:hypothetical protein